MVLEMPLHLSND